MSKVHTIFSVPELKTPNFVSATTQSNTPEKDTGYFHPDKKVNVCWQAAANSPEQLIWRKAPRTI